MENFLNVEELEGLWATAEQGFSGTHWSKPREGARAPPSRPYVVLRPWTLLNASFHPEAAAVLGGGATTRVRWVEDEPRGEARAAARRGGGITDGDTDGGGDGGKGRGGGAAATVRLPLGLTDAELREALRPAESAALLHLEHAEAPIFGGWGARPDLRLEPRTGRWRSAHGLRLPCSGGPMISPLISHDLS